MYSYETRVTNSHAGADRLQTPLSIVTMMQDCSVLWLESEPTFADWLARDDVAMMIASRQVDIYRRMSYGERVEVRTSVYKVKGPLGYRNTALYDEAGEMTACCWGIGPFVSFETAKMVKPPAEVAASIAIDPEVEMERLPRAIALPDVEPRRAEPFAAQRSDLDINRHVNNAQYLRMAYEYLPEGFDLKRMRFEYKGQCRLGQQIVPTLYDAGEVFSVVLSDADGAPYTVVEFS